MPQLLYPNHLAESKWRRKLKGNMTSANTSWAM